MENTIRAKFIWNLKQGQESGGRVGRGGFVIPESFPKGVKKTSQLLTGSSGKEKSAQGGLGTATPHFEGEAKGVDPV